MLLMILLRYYRVCLGTL